MGFLDRFEQRIERAVEGAAAKVFRGTVEPVEIASALQREAATKRAVLGVGRIVAPNRYTVRLSPTDHERLAEYEEQLASELCGVVSDYLVEQRWATFGVVGVDFEQDTDLDTGMFRVESAVEVTAAPGGGGGGGSAQMAASGTADAGRTAVVPTLTGGAHLLITSTGQQVTLSVGMTTLGRGTGTQVTVNDTSVSRRHAEIRWTGTHASVSDLGSTNGTFRNGRPIPVGQWVELSDGDTLRLGNTTITYRQDG